MLFLYLGEGKSPRELTSLREGGGAPIIAKERDKKGGPKRCAPCLFSRKGKKGKESTRSCDTVGHT